jgi:hypothetical protein
LRKDLRKEKRARSVPSVPSVVFDLKLLIDNINRGGGRRRGGGGF